MSCPYSYSKNAVFTPVAEYVGSYSIQSTKYVEGGFTMMMETMVKTVMPTYACFLSCCCHEFDKEAIQPRLSHSLGYCHT